jgi:hypothetical protein
MQILENIPKVKRILQTDTNMTESKVFTDSIACWFFLNAAKNSKMEVQSMILAPTGCQFSFQMSPNLVNYDYIFKILISEWFWSFEILIISHLNSKFIKICWLNKCDFLKHLWFLDVLFCCDFLLSFCCDFMWPFVISFDRLWFCIKSCDFIKIL